MKTSFKLFILFMVSVTWFGPAIVVMNYYHSPEGAVFWLVVGWHPALVVGSFLEKK